MSKKAIKEIVSFLAILLIATLASPLHGYWTEGVDAPKSVVKDKNTVTIGTAKQVGENIIITPPQPNTQILVPVGRLESVGGQPANPTDTLRFEFTVSWQTSDQTSPLPVKPSDQVLGIPYLEQPQRGQDFLKVCPSDGCREGNVDLSSFFTVTVTPEEKPIVLNGEPFRFAVEVTMKEPESKVLYERIRNRNLTITLGRIAVVRLDTLVANGTIPSINDWKTAYDMLSGIKTRP